MLKSLTLLTIQGIPVRVHPTFALLLVWIVVRWGIQGSAGALLFGIVLMAFVFLFVVLHELGHAMMALQSGIRAHEITLLPIGGVTRFDHVPDGPRREAGIALAGPAVNIACAMAIAPLLLAYGAARGLRSPGDYIGLIDGASLGGLLASLFFVNVVLAGFNLLPAFPMDGGRVLRAAGSRYVGYEQATRIAVWAGQIIAVGMIVLGIMIGDIVLPLMAIVIIVLAWSEGRALEMEAAMRRLRVGQFALWESGGIAPNVPIRFAFPGGPRDLAVTEDNRVIGMLWRHQLLASLHGGAGDRLVSDVMDTNVVVVDARESVYHVQRRMRETGRWAVPVVEDGIYRGIFTTDRFVHVYRYVNNARASRRRWRQALDRVEGAVRERGEQPR
jgi:Zn-dependent protease